MAPHWSRLALLLPCNSALEMPLRGQGAPEVNFADESGVISIKREKVYLFFLFSSALGSPNNDGT